MNRFAGKTVVITGAAGGIGAALTKEFLVEGATVFALDLNEKPLSDMASEARKFSQPLQTLTVDVSNLEQMRQRLSEILKITASIDFWINNAGVSGLGDFMEKSLEEFDQTIRVNLGGVSNGTRLALEHMDGFGHGSIVNVASVAGHVSAPYLSAYCASKYAVVGFTRALRQEMKLKDSPIKLVLASPGFVDTQMIARGTQHGFPEWLSFLLSTPEKVAKEMVEGIVRGDEEIFPTRNGKMILKMHRLFPQLTSRGSKLLLSKSLKDLILLRKRPP